MQKLLYASVIAMALGCGQVPMDEVSANVAPEPVKAVMPAVQRTITAFDAQGQPYQVTVTETQPTAPAMRGEKVPLPKAKVEPLTLEKVGAEFDEVLSEMKQVLTKGAGDSRVTEICRPLVKRLHEAREG